MPRKKQNPELSLTEIEQKELPSLEQGIEEARGGTTLVPLATPNTPQSRDNILAQRDTFDADAAAMLIEVKRVLMAILKDDEADNKSRLSASKLVLQVNGLLERRQTVDQETMTNLLNALTRRTAVNIKDVTGV